MAGGFLICYLLLSIEMYLATYTIGTFHLSYWQLGPTELRILLSIGNLFALWSPHAIIAGREFLLFDVGFAIGDRGIGRDPDPGDGEAHDDAVSRGNAQ